MPKYMKKPRVPPKVVWLVNPDDRVIDAEEHLPMVGFARRNTNGWRLATEEQIAEALAEREERNAVAMERQTKRKAATEVAKDMAAAASSLVEGEASASPKPRRSKPKKGDAD